MRQVEIEKYVIGNLADSPTWLQVSAIADQLLKHLNSPECLNLLDLADQPGLSSAEVQSAFLGFARSLGFVSEKKGLFADSGLSLRPDYYRPIQSTGILLEVERGKTTINNMDLLDFWKCHLCPQAHYLFLLVPTALRQNPRMSPRNEFATVKRRLSQFFVPSNETNVHGLCIFGY